MPRRMSWRMRVKAARRGLRVVVGEVRSWPWGKVSGVDLLGRGDVLGRRTC